jgi:hypothetical protein
VLRNLLGNLLGRSRGKVPAAALAGTASEAPAPPPGPLELAREAYRLRRYDEAVRQHAVLPPGAARPFGDALALAHSLQYLKRFRDAAEVYGALDAALASGGERDQATLVRLQLGLSRLRAGDAAGAEASFGKALAGAPGHPWAQKISAYPAVMAEPLAIERRALARMEPAAAQATELPVDLVYFFTAPADQARAAEYWRLFGPSVASARRVYPGCRVVLLTDRGTQAPADIGFDLTLRADLPAGELMLNRMKANLAYLEHIAAQGGATAAVLTESDCVMQRDLRPLLGRGAALVLTSRSNFVDEAEDLEPCNTGTMVLDLREAPMLSSFFGHCAAAIASLENRPAVRRAFARPIREWRGDQLAVGAVLGWREFNEHVLSGRTDRLEAGGCTVGFVPSDPYNFGFEPGLDPAVLAAKYVLHYKGERKRHLLAGGPSPAST